MGILFLWCLNGHKPMNSKNKPMRKMRITLHKDGTQTIEVFGFKGNGCIEFTKQLEERLGKPVAERILKPEYYQSEGDLHEHQIESEIQ